MGKAAAAPKEKKARECGSTWHFEYSDARSISPTQEKAPKDPNAPKRALAAYMIFCKVCFCSAAPRAHASRFK